MLVRIFAETGYKQLMCKVHQLLRSHWDMQRTIKLRGEWVDVDPQGWRQRTDTIVNVGLGNGTRQQNLAMLTQLVAMQKEAAGQGMSNPKKIYRALEKMVAASGLGDARMYFTDPESPEFQPPEPPPPDPQTVLAQAQAQALQQEQQRKGQEFQVNAQIDMQKSQQDAQIKQAELEGKNADRALKERELALKEIELEQQGALASGELEAKIENIRADTQLKKAQSDKTMAEGAATAVEAGSVYKKALEIVSESGELNEGGSLPDIEMEDSDNGDGEGSTESETEE